MLRHKLGQCFYDGMRLSFVYRPGLPLLFVLMLTSSVWAGPRTDGPSGAEYGKFDYLMDGGIQAGFHFGTLLNSDTDRDASFSLGGDIDYRPDELFGLRLAYFQGLNSPRSSLINLTPHIHSRFYNAEPYVLFGPGVAFVSQNGDLKTKFNLATGAGIDFMFTERLGLGLEYIWNSLIDANDLHLIGARIVFNFPIH